jgi:prephenate dehydrogenase
MKPIGRLVVIGVGLIGGSLALSLRAGSLVHEVVGIGRGRHNLDEALRLAIIDRVADDYPAGLDGADIVLIATPVAQFPAVLAQLAPHLGPATIVTDGGSTKQDVIAAARTALGPRFCQFVPGHPIAGTEHTGAGAAFPELFRNRKVVLTPEAETPRETLARVREMWESAGATVVDLPAERHDAILAAVSHLPHLLAFALVEELALRPDAPDYFRFAAGGFRDFTRIASSSPEMWRDIAIANRGPLLEELRRYRGQVERLEELVAAGDADALIRLFATARDARNDWLARQP